MDLDDNEYPNIQDILNRAKPLLNWRFDKNLNPFPKDDEIDYQIRDISNLKESEIFEIISHFFTLKFENVINTPLYRFLILKNDKSIRILANISSLIFDYSSIKEFYELINDSDKREDDGELSTDNRKNNDKLTTANRKDNSELSTDNRKNNSELLDNRKTLDSHYKTLKEYLNSSDFKKDSAYWKNYILDSGKYIKFYNIKDNSLKSQRIHINKDSVLSFTEKHDCSLFDFYASVFSLYLSRVDRLEGCLLKTVIPGNTGFDKNTLIKIDINKNNTFNELLNQFKSSYKNSIQNTKTDVNNYIDDETTFYSVYDFTNLSNTVIYTLKLYTTRNSF